MNSIALEAIIEVAIGMIFMWLVLSIATMSIQEWIASYLKWRAKDLDAAIQRLLGDKTWAEQFYNHPLIAGLSKKVGSKPSYIPANKFALALHDIVRTAGTQESFIQQKLLDANRELNKTPKQLGPFLVHIYKRFGRNIGRFFNRILFFFGRNKGTPDQKYARILELTKNFLHSNDPEKSEDLAEGLEALFGFVLSDTTKINGKDVSISSAEFLDAYPRFRDYFYGLIKVAVENQPILKLRWSEIMIHSSESWLKKAKEELAEGQTLREKLREYAENYAKDFALEDETLESIIVYVRQTLDEIDFAPLVDAIQSQIGSSTQGLDALQALNPTLHKSLQQLYGDIIGVVNNEKMVDAIRDRFAEVAIEAGQIDRNLAVMRINAETWFNESMDRLSGWYKRKSTVLAFVIGLVLASILHVDSILLAQHLWKEPTLRQALAANATEFAEKNPELPVVKVEETEESTASTDTEEPAAPEDAIEFFEDQFEGLDVPLGWTFEPIEIQPDQPCRLIPIGANVIWGLKDTMNPAICQRINNAPTDTAGWFLKVMGIILSAGAAAQGAPFWFDLLKKLVNIRGSGTRPDEKS
jgi:hypothetical protein